jgi:succinate-acetate transporter protein
MTTEKIEIAVANPAPLGLLGFGMTTILLNLHNAQIIPLSAVIVAMGVFIGGLAQVFAGIMEFRNRNTFAATAFTSYGFFWLSLVSIWMNPFPGINKADAQSVAFYLMIWGIYTTFMFVGTLKHGRGLQIVFLSAALLFFTLSVADFTGNKGLTYFGGWLGIVCGASALYNSVAQIVNGEHGKNILPL